MSLNSMQSTLRKFHKWMEKNEDSFAQRIAIAYDLFWGEREGLSKANQSEKLQGVFQEWLALDFSLNGFVNPIRKRTNFFDYFLKEEAKNLTSAEKIFGKNLKNSFRSFYHIESVEKGMCVNLKDAFSGKKFQMWDVNTAKNVQEGDIMLTRVVKNEKEKYISGGFGSDVINTPFFEILKEMILMTHQSTEGTPDESSLEEFLKWNGYIYIRDIYNPEDFLEGIL